MHRDRNTRSHSRVFVILGVLVLAGAAYWLFTEGPGVLILSPLGLTVAEFSGPGAMTIESFNVREGWQVHWDSESDSFSLAIRGDRDFGTRGRTRRTDQRDHLSGERRILPSRGVQPKGTGRSL